MAHRNFRLSVVGLGTVCLALLAFSCCHALAQTTTSSPTDQLTPPALTPGAPAGSYAIGGFENVNLFNGNLNFVLPLLHIGGRGEAAYTMTLSFNSKGWNVRRSTTGSTVTFTPQLNTWNPLEVVYSPGVMAGRFGGQGSLQTVFPGACPSRNPLYQYTYTRLTFALADGTEIDFRDQLTGGQPQLVPSTACQNPGALGFSRGTVFVTNDGSAATFVSDTAITDRNIAGGNGTFTPSGDLYLASGLHYRIDNGQVSWMQDRNGNRITFGFNAAGLATVTDPLNRQVTIQRNVTDSTYGLGDRITYSGFAGAPRVIFIAKGLLQDSLRSDQSLQTYIQLFPELLGGQNYVPNTFNPQITSGIYLPDGRRFRFLYNSYGELARVELPTGGAYEYDMTPGSGVISNGGPCSEDPDLHIYRRVMERRTSPDGTQFDSKMRFNVSPDGSTITVDHLDPNQGDRLLEREIHSFFGNAVDGLFAPQPAFIFWEQGKEIQTDIQDGNGSPLRRATSQFQQSTPVPWWSQWLAQSIIANPPGCFNQGGEPANDPQMFEADTILTDVVPNLVARKTFTYGKFNNVIETDEFDYGASSPTRVTLNTYLTSQTVGGVSVDYVHVSSNPQVTPTLHLRRLMTSTTVEGQVNGSLTPLAATNYNYDEDGSPITNEPGIVGQGSGFSTSFRTRGNQTSVTRYTNAAALSGPITSKATYDVAGNIASRTDPNNNTTTYTYDSTGSAFAFVSTATLPVPGLHGSGTALVVQKTNDLNTGQITSFTSANNQVTRYDYTDPLDRLVHIADPDGGSITYSYGDVAGDLFLHTVTALDGSRNMEAYAYFDGLGRNIRKLNLDGTTGLPWIATETTYDALGHPATVTNPHRVSQPSATRDGCSPTAPCTTTAYDALGRIASVTTPDGQSVTSTHAGNSVLLTDQVGNTKNEVIDALDRLVQVTENPSNLNNDGSPVTTYTYDALSNLLCVHQKGADTTPDKTCGDATVPATWRPRNFTYDSLSRLLTASNPESGMSQYGYDNNGNLTSKTNANHTSTTTTYDALNRPSTVTYSDGTPSLTYSYDGNVTPPPGAGSNPLGRLSLLHSADPSGGDYSFDKYDAMGRVLRTTQTVDNQAYVMSYAYDLAGHLVNETYPSGRVVQTGYDPDGRVNSLSAPQSNPAPYADQIQYSAHNDVTDLLLGNGLWEHTNFDPNRLQTTEIDVGTSKGAVDLLSLQYDYHDINGNNNGDVRRQMIIAPGLAVTQLVQYDGLNRIWKMQEVSGANAFLPFQPTSVWEQDFTHDFWGNRTGLVSTGGLLTSLAPAIDTNNRIDVTKDGRYSYDSAGYVKQEPVGAASTSGTNVYTYDAEGHLVQSQEGSATQVFKYDGRGQRVKKIAGSTATVYVRDASGQLIAEYSNTTATKNGTRYLTQDVLGNERLVTGTDSSGKPVVAARYDYLPFGELIPTGLSTRSSVAGYGANDVSRQKFIGKEHDDESGLDYFGGRYLGDALGRFSSPEPLNIAGIQRTDPHAFTQIIRTPKHWNAYSYSLDDPLNKLDPDGLLTIIVAGTHSKSQNWNQDSAFVKKVGHSFHETPVILGVGLKNSKADRQKVAVQLADVVAHHQFAPGERLNIVGHSHGGNVANIASHNVNHKIDVLVTLGTPVRPDHMPNEANIGLHLNVFSKKDMVQTMLGGGTTGIAGRTFEGAKNLDATQYTSGPIGSHSDLVQNPEVWDKVVQPELVPGGWPPFNCNNCPGSHPDRQ